MNQTFRFLIRTLIAGLLPITAWAGPVNVNTADAKTLAKELDGIERELVSPEWLEQVISRPRISLDT